MARQHAGTQTDSPSCCAGLFHQLLQELASTRLQLHHALEARQSSGADDLHQPVSSSRLQNAPERGSLLSVSGVGPLVYPLANSAGQPSTQLCSAQTGQQAAGSRPRQPQIGAKEGDSTGCFAALSSRVSDFKPIPVSGISKEWNMLADCSIDVVAVGQCNTSILEDTSYAIVAGSSSTAGSSSMAGCSEFISGTKVEAADTDADADIGTWAGGSVADDAAQCDSMAEAAETVRESESAYTGCSEFISGTKVEAPDTDADADIGTWADNAAQCDSMAEAAETIQESETAYTGCSEFISGTKVEAADTDADADIGTWADGSVADDAAQCDSMAEAAETVRESKSAYTGCSEFISGTKVEAADTDADTDIGTWADVSVADNAAQCDSMAEAAETVRESESAYTGLHQLLNCRLCPASFPTWGQLKQHVATEHLDSHPYRCSRCGARYARRGHLINHIRSVHRGKRQRFAQPPTHNSEPLIPCPVCNKAFTKKAELQQHEASVHQSALSHVDGLPHEPTSAENLRENLCVARSQGPEAESPAEEIIQPTPLVPSVTYPCGVCGTQFSDQVALEAHSEAHSTEEALDCDKVLINQADHQHLEASEHFNEGPNKCGDPGNLGKQQTYHQCLHCNRRFKHPCDLRRHGLMHASPRPVHCGDCGMQFTDAGELCQHALAQHASSRPFGCGYCSLRFKQWKYLQSHIRTHSDERPFPCQACGKRFRRLAHLQEHARMHTGELPFTCNICGQRFRRISGLQKHTRVHRQPRREPASLGTSE